ncbi:uncharacterized protein DUF4148 [Paraburkholderia sp. BL6665CI2N2]|uniref:DUF4148 domain-containing protein n=1 Tax=Paraburkholderia sp. BL6665CI2N2 TaxID=1938806 RepID=UPI0010664DC8|nr:DUF4148 domain-containing protein [Paraburkholderia sp. BL6665CI2N2]TDY16674.1 uncharacterized protein DUF4148 [Paraburkholderia sp. BL6665CI2N2]
MKLLTAFAVTVLGLSFGANAFAQTSPHELTRAEVQSQLVEAEAEGLVPAPKSDYPPSAQAVARNREIYAIQRRTDGARFTKRANPVDVSSESTSN